MIIKVLMAGVAMSFAWPVRGQFGHFHGALILGAIAVLVSSAWLSAPVWRQAFMQTVAFGAVGFGIGGDFSYGSLVDGILLMPTLLSAWPDLLQVFIIGAIWGVLGLSFIGYGLQAAILNTRDFIALGLFAFLSWLCVTLFSTSLPMVFVYGFLMLVLLSYLYFFQHFHFIRSFAVFGALGFGGGFLIAVIILYLGNKGFFGGTWWQLRDQIWGFIGGCAAFIAFRQKSSSGWNPSLLSVTWIKRAGFTFFLPLIGIINVVDVAIKWFASNPPAPSLVLSAGIIVLACLILLGWTIFFWKVPPSSYALPSLNRLLLFASVFFIWFVGILAILKKVVYYGWSSWETAFTLFIIDAVIISITLLIELN